MTDFLLDLLGAFIMSVTYTVIFALLCYFAVAAAFMDPIWMEPVDSEQVWMVVRASWAVAFGCSLLATFLPERV